MIDGSPSAFAFAVPDGRGVRRRARSSLGRGVIEALGLRFGDRVRMSVGGRDFAATLVGPLRRAREADGRGAVMLAATVPAAALTRPGWIVRLERGADAARAEAGIARLGAGRLFVHRPGESLREEVGEMRPIVYGSPRCCSPSRA